MMIPVLAAVTLLTVAAPTQPPIITVTPSALVLQSKGAVVKEVICQSTWRGETWVTRCRVLVRSAKAPRSMAPVAKKPPAKPPEAKATKPKAQLLQKASPPARKISTVVPKPSKKRPAIRPKRSAPKAKAWVVIIPPPAPSKPGK